MHKLYDNIKKELEKIEETGLNSGNLDTAYKLLSMGKNVKKIDKIEKEEKEDRMMRYEDDYGARGRYRGDDYGARGRYRDGEYSAYIEGSYERGGRGRYRDGQKYERMYGHIEKMEDGIDMYSYGKDRYRDSGDTSRVMEGLEKLMYGICMMVETAMDFAETPEEKEIIHKHIQKLKNK